MKSDNKSTPAPSQQYQLAEYFHGDLRKGAYLKRRADYSAPSQQHQSAEYFHGDLRKGAYLKRRADYLTQAENGSALTQAENGSERPTAGSSLRSASFD